MGLFRGVGEAEHAGVRLGGGAGVEVGGHRAAQDKGTPGGRNGIGR
ncbi:hypothetical protein A176_002468 [Myxococcus hansupus]|uniref:Uncharacterized protein n=1 Tax=Pseudomyxococcus hansupus TaxID=1297742 RepID=A0A0H4WPY0_9BACT|nr:hypothetical protein A176_002468 [Myxococcus hansupus]